MLWLFSVSLTHGAIGWFAVCDCGFSRPLFVSAIHFTVKDTDDSVHKLNQLGFANHAVRLRKYAVKVSLLYI